MSSSGRDPLLDGARTPTIYGRIIIALLESAMTMVVVIDVTTDNGFTSGAPAHAVTD